MIFPLKCMGNTTKLFQPPWILLYDLLWKSVISLQNEDFSISNAVFMYPNPVSETLQLHFTHELVLHSVTIYSMLGQKLSKTNQSVVDFSDFASGVYLVEVATNQGTLSKKVVKN